SFCAPGIWSFLQSHRLGGFIKVDGFVKSPSVPLGAGLRFNPALLGKNFRFWDTGTKPLRFE
ncbi:MAG: hypothetical protein NTV04_05275, partial [Deltaproteobacteria bacterium]|nr:hypothetical protein [Deltaproteobacteria bacterium]